MTMTTTTTTLTVDVVTRKERLSVHTPHTRGCRRSTVCHGSTPSSVLNPLPTSVDDGRRQNRNHQGGQEDTSHSNSTKQTPLVFPVARVTLVILCGPGVTDDQWCWSRRVITQWPAHR